MFVSPLHMDGHHLVTYAGVDLLGCQPCDSSIHWEKLRVWTPTSLDCHQCWVLPGGGRFFGYFGGCVMVPHCDFNLHFPDD